MTDGLKDVHREAIIATIAVNDRVERAVLFGSRATGTNTVTSDVDIALFGERLTLTDQARLAAALDELPMAQRVDLLLYTAIDSPALREQIERHGVEWYRRPPGTANTRIAEGAGGPMPQSPLSYESLVKNKPIKMPITKAVEINPTIKLKRGDNYAFVAMADLDGVVTRVRSSNTKAFKGSGARFLHGDTLFARITPCLENGKVAKYLGTVGEAGFGSTEFIVFRGRDGITATDYAHYLATDPNFRSFAISKMTGSSGRQRVPVDALESYVVQIPPIEWQRAIAHILGTLDDKIEVNRRMNATLEAMARAIFKDWFVDFGPTRTKMAMRGEDPQNQNTTRKPYLAPEIRDLFPDRLDDEGKPEGWEGKPLTEFFSIIGGGTPKTSNADYWTGLIPWFSVTDTPAAGSVFVTTTEKTITDAGLHGSSARLVPKGTTIISARGTVGNLAVAGCEMAFNQSCYGLKGAAPVGNYATYLIAQNTVNQLRAMAHGSVFSTITRRTFESLSLPMPSPGILEYFEYAVSPLFERIFTNVEESRTLAQTRDLLLPRLMSGKIRLKDAERTVEEVT